ncbi:MAG TPA: hypothetical protein PK644_01670, partial [bacterium]|nr:hypothetical protein [bacterium]
MARELNHEKMKAIEEYLSTQRKAGLLSEEFYSLARKNVVSHLQSWLECETIRKLVPGFVRGVNQAFQEN